MTNAPDSETSLSLLERLRHNPTNQQAWNEFVRRYQPRIHGWCRSWGLQEADAEDVTQTVLAKLAEKMRSFQYDPAHSFRAWLRTVTQHAWSDFVTARRHKGADGEKVQQLLESLEARADLEKQLAESFDCELLEVAMQRVRERVEPATWEAFRRTALEGLSGAEAAQHVAMPIAHIYVAKRRVQKMIQEELRRLEGE